MKKLQYALIKDNCTFKESLTPDLKPLLESNTNIALNFGPSIGRRATLSAKLTSSNGMKSACNGKKQKVNLTIMKSATMKKLMKM